jgi:hypothetical protein
VALFATSTRTMMITQNPMREEYSFKLVLCVMACSPPGYSGVT